MNTSIIDTYQADIFVGLCPGYDARFSEAEQFEILRATCRLYCNTEKLAVTITRTEFMYVDGNEPGVIVGLINYPRFQRHEAMIKDLAVLLAFKLKEALRQERVSVVCTDETIMLGEK